MRMYLKHRVKDSNHASQSALEYMMTYGWAILIIVIVAAVLYYMGIFNPNASSTVPFQATGFQNVPVINGIANSSALDIQIANELGTTIDLHNVSIQIGNTAYKNFTCLSNTLLAGESSYCYLQANFSQQQIDASATITYTQLNNNLAYNSTGAIRIEVSPGIIVPQPCNRFTFFSNSTNQTLRGTLNYTVRKQSSVALLIATGGGGNITSVKVPSGCTQLLLDTNSGFGNGEAESIYAAKCSQSAGNYTLNATTGAKSDMALGAYVFGFKSCGLTFNSTIGSSGSQPAFPQAENVSTLAVLSIPGYQNYLCVGGSNYPFTALNWASKVSAANSSFGYDYASIGNSYQAMCNETNSFSGGVGNSLYQLVALVGVGST